MKKIAFTLAICISIMCVSGCDAAQVKGNGGELNTPEIEVSGSESPTPPDSLFSTDSVEIEVSDDVESTNQTVSGAVPLNFSTTIDSMYELSWLYEIRPLLPSDIKEILIEKAFDDYRVLFYLGIDQCSYVGVETSNGCFTLFQISNEPANPPVYFDTYQIEEFENILGTKGVKVSLLIGLAFELTAYYTVEDGQPELIAYANLSTEVDLDDDGKLEIISTYPSMMPSCIVIKDFDGIPKWSGDVKDILSANRGVVFDEETKTFNVFYSIEADPTLDDSDNWINKSYVYSEENLIER